MSHLKLLPKPTKKRETVEIRLFRLQRVYRRGEARMEANLRFSEMMGIENRVIRRFWQIDDLLENVAKEIATIQTRSLKW